MSEENAARPLTDDELGRLDELLEAASPENAMVLEQLDGFCAALACSPSPLGVDDYLPAVLGVGASGEDEPGVDAAGAATQAAAATATDPGAGLDALRALVDRHQRSIVAALHAGEGLEPVLERDERGVARANLWAIGFLQGVDFQADAWSALDSDPELGALLEAAETLADERDLATDRVRRPLRRDRQALVDEMIDAAFVFYDRFEDERRRASAPPPARRDPARVGRNDPCPCGSGRKFKQCCGAGR